MRIKNSIAGKLISYFAVFLLIFALVVGSVFSFLLTNQTTSLHKQELEKKAEAIAEAISDYMEGSSMHGNGRGNGGHGAYMMLIDQIAMTDVWVMDESSNLITFGHGNQAMNYKELPAEAGEVINEALSGESSFSESFSDLLGQRSITVGTPIMSSGGKVLGVVMLHAPVEGIDSAISDGKSIMTISIVLALLLAAVAAVLLALSFTRPLRNMKNTALRLAAGDYSARTNIHQRDEIGQLAITLDELSLRLEEADKQRAQLTKLRQDFIANISHELRTPVTVLRGSLEAICDGVVKGEDMVESYHQQMLSDSIYLERLVNDLLELSRLQSAGFAIEMSEMDLCAALQDAVRSITPLASKRSIQISVESALSYLKLQGDYGRIRQMLLVVLDNAVKFSNENNRVIISLQKEEHKAVLSIKDRGAVIPPEELPNVFDRFHKSNHENNKKGTGLGLPIAKEIAKRHGISLGATSTVEETTFYFEIPLG